MTGILDRLKGGDLRSTGAADRVAREAERDPSLVAQLIGGLDAEEPVVRMRCADALEKATRRQPEYLAPYGNVLLQLLDPEQPKEVLWHILQMTPRIAWRPRKLAKVFPRVEACLSSGSSIVKVMAMQALFELTQQDPEKEPEVHALLRALSRSGTPAMKARGSKLVRKLEKK